MGPSVSVIHELRPWLAQARGATFARCRDGSWDTSRVFGRLKKADGREGIKIARVVGIYSKPPIKDEEEAEE
jgi:hypothetical protein